MLDADSLRGAGEDVTAAYYLVHSMGRGTDREGFAERERRAASNFARMAKEEGVERVVYLGGLGDERSEHLRSRAATAATLAQEGPPLVYFRAAMVIGAGSESYRTVRYLVERLPAMIAPAWLRNRDPADRNRRRARVPGSGRRAAGRGAGEVQIGGPDVLTYSEVLALMADVLGKRRRPQIPVPFLTPRPLVALDRPGHAGGHGRRAPARGEPRERDDRDRSGAGGGVRRAADGLPRGASPYPSGGADGVGVMLSGSWSSGPQPPRSPWPSRSASRAARARRRPWSRSSSSTTASSAAARRRRCTTAATRSSPRPTSSPPPRPRSWATTRSRSRSSRRGSRTWTARRPARPRWMPRFTTGSASGSACRSGGCSASRRRPRRRRTRSGSTRSTARATASRRASEFRALKIKVGGAEDLARLEAVRDESDAPLRVDANEGWTLESARELMPELIRLGVEFVEQPFPAARPRLVPRPARAPPASPGGRGRGLPRPERRGTGGRVRRRDQREAREVRRRARGCADDSRRPRPRTASDARLHGRVAARRGARRRDRLARGLGRPRRPPAARRPAVHRPALRGRARAARAWSRASGWRPHERAARDLRRGPVRQAHRQDRARRDPLRQRATSWP